MKNNSPLTFVAVLFKLYKLVFFYLYVVFSVHRLSGHCSHILGLIETFQGFKLHNLTHVPDQLSSTSLPQQWDKPRGTKIKPAPVKDVVVSRPLENRKRKPIL